MEIRWMDGLNIGGQAVPAHVAALLNRPIREFASGIRSLLGKERDAAVAEFKSTLRGLVDQWIDSGKANETITGDEPMKRNISWRSPLYPEPFGKTVIKFWEARVTVELDDSPVFHVGLSEAARGSKDSLFTAREYAVHEFARLLASPSPQRLSRCDGCGRYFVRQRVPTKPICHGTFCSRGKCKSKGGAKRVVDSRDQIAKSKICWAADALEQWKPASRFGEKPDWVVEQVNAKLLPRGESIKVNWFTWHQTEIEAEVERRKHAKG